MCKPTQEMALIEVGAFAGDATKIFCKHFKYVDVVDPWESGRGDISNKVDMNEVYKKFIENTIHVKPGCLTVNKMTFLQFYDKSFYLREDDLDYDMIYIDALHDYESVRIDIEKARFLINDRIGILAGHDYTEAPYQGKQFPGVVQAVDEIGGPDCVFSDSSWIKIHKAN